jgi:tellurite methyltransferase
MNTSKKTHFQSDSKVFWNNFYKKHKHTHKPTSFAAFCLPYINKKSTLIELGCGNGRDSFFFAKNKIKVYAFDISMEAINWNNQHKIKGLVFTQGDFTKLDLKKFNISKIGNIYSRFTLHSVEKSGFDKTIQWVSKSLDKGGRFFIEARTIHDKLFGKGKQLPNNGFFTTHYRRFLEILTVKKKLEKSGFKLICCTEDYVSAQLNNDGAVVLRIIAEKL